MLTKPLQLHPPPTSKLMSRSFICSLLAIICVFSFTPQTKAVVIDPAAWGLVEGNTFRLVMVTYGVTNASSTNITDYDAFVNTQGLNGITYNGNSMLWQALGTTMDSYASLDATRFSSQANATQIFNLNGNMVSNNNFWAINHDAPINVTINGSGNLETLTSGRAYTGFGYDGVPRPQRNHTSEWDSTDVYSALGQVAPYTGITWDDDMNAVLVPGLIWGVAAGNLMASHASWPDGEYVETPDTIYHHMYAMSELITVVANPIPEPNLAVAGMFVLVMAAVVRRKIRKLD